MTEFSETMTKASSAFTQRFAIRLRWLTPLVCLIFATVATASATANAELLGEFGTHGSGAGELFRVEGVATDPQTGDVFLVDAENYRVDEFTPWGGFVKAFGWDVAPGAVNEQQEVTVKATTGQFKLSFGAASTIDLEHNAPANASEGGGSVEAALNALPSISTGGGAVKVAKGPTDASSSRYVISFAAGPLAGADVPQIVSSDGTTPLSGGAPTSAATVITRVDGTSATTGLESCTAESGCKAGVRGTGAGQFDVASGIAVDLDGNVYVREYGETDRRVQKFDSTGRFILMIGGEVDKTTKADLCTAASGDVCGEGVSGTGASQFSLGFGVAVGTDNLVAVPDQGRIQEFEGDGTFKRSIPVPGSVSESHVGKVAVDPSSGNLDIINEEPTSRYPGEIKTLHKLSPIGAELPITGCDVRQPTNIATDSQGDLYVVEEKSPAEGKFEGSPEKIRELSSSCDQIAEIAQEPGPGASGFTPFSAIGTNTAGDLLAARSNNNDFDEVRIYGPPPVSFEPPPPAPPTIAAQRLISADFDRASVKATIDPNFWADTTYEVEYGTGKCSEGGCPSTQPVPAASLGAGVVRAAVGTSAVELSGLAAATTYHYRFVARSGGGGPVRGVGGAVGEDGAEASFTTARAPDLPEACPENEAFRIGASASLPDCRAYEMVSPIDKEGGDTLALADLLNISTALDQSALNGNALTYTSNRAFGDAISAPFASQYLARRGTDGWSSEALAPPRDGPSVFEPAGAGQANFKAFSPDLCQAWLSVDAPPLPSLGGVEGFDNLYRRQNCPQRYQAITGQSASFEPELQGVSGDGSEAIFRSNELVYRSVGGELSPVCILPDGTPYPDKCSAGTLAVNAFGLTEAPGFNGAFASVKNAISVDGSHIYWSGLGGNQLGGGKIYLRVDNEATLPVSETETTKAAHFWAASADGSKALFEVEDLGEKPTAKNENLYLYDEVEEASTLIAGKVIGVAAQSEDLSRVYFVSEEALGGASTAGKPNLYLHEDAGNRFIATLSVTDAHRDTGVPSYTDTSKLPLDRVTQASADGDYLVFISNEPLTGFDNIDAETGLADVEVFRYDAASEALSCGSCSPTGAAPVGRPVQAPDGNSTQAAALLPGGEGELYTTRALVGDGSRLFYTAYTDLVPGDRNGAPDVYEWEAPGSGGCTVVKAAYSAINGGCVYLISDGKAPDGSQLVDSSASGKDVFFTTEASLVPQDPGLVDIYDARAGGGFASPTVPNRCDPAGGGCQTPPPEPETFGAPASGNFSGSGNVTPAPLKPLVKPKPLTRAQELTKALKGCRKEKGKGKRTACEKQARKRYRAKARKKAKR